VHLNGGPLRPALRRLAPFGPHAMSDLSPLCTQERTSTKRRSRPKAASRFKPDGTRVRFRRRRRSCRRSGSFTMVSLPVTLPPARCAAQYNAKAAKGFPRRLFVALRLRGGVLRRAVSNVTLPASPWDARPLQGAMCVTNVSGQRSPIMKMY
jgi:hypothetical protein